MLQEADKMAEVLELSKLLKLQRQINWVSWRFRLKVKLTSMRAIKIVEGKEPKPQGPADNKPASKTTFTAALEQ